VTVTEYGPEAERADLARRCDELTMRPEKPTVPEVLPLLREYYLENPTGGAVHIITDDGNTEQGHADWCVEWAASREFCPYCDHPGPHHLAIAKLLQRCSGTQRGKLARLAHTPAPYEVTGQ